VHVRVNAATSVDGKLSTRHREQVPISGPADFERVDRIRADADAVLVGVGTVLVDDPRLDVRDAPLDGPQPRPVVLDSRARTPTDATVVQRGAVVVTTEAASQARRSALEDAGAEVVLVGAAAGRVDLLAAVHALADIGIAEIYAEPGSGLSASLVTAGLVDEFVLHRGGVEAAGWPRAWHHGQWRVVRSRPLGRDREVVARPV